MDEKIVDGNGIELSLGCRVELLKADGPVGGMLKEGSRGTVLFIDRNINGIGVEWDDFYAGHEMSLHSKERLRPCRKGAGWNVQFRRVAVVAEKESAAVEPKVSGHIRVEPKAGHVVVSVRW